MSEEAKTVADDRAPPPDSIREVEEAPISTSTLRSNRMWAAAGYFAFFVGAWIVVPAIAYAWRGRGSRFVAFHAVQAVLLQVAFIPCMAVGMVFSDALHFVSGSRRGHETGAELIAVVVMALLATSPILATAWLGFSALRGKTRALPALGRWAKRIVTDAAKP